MKYDLINNGKQPNEAQNAALGFWLPPDSPYGNFQLKFMKIIQRLDEANRRIIDSYKFWESCGTQGFLPIGALERHVFANEQAIYMMRRAADELVSLIWCLSKYEEDSEYPDKIKIDCLGAILSQNEQNRNSIYTPHMNLMQQLNDIANAFKHSFINSDHTLMGVQEPRVHALALNYNKLKSSPTFSDVSLSELINKYNLFYKDCVSWLSQYSERNR
jgi:hypothetical protein